VASACILALTIGGASAGLAQTKKSSADESPTFSSRKDNKDGSSAMTFGTRLPAAVETKVGVDLGVPASPDLAPDPDRLLRGAGSDRGSGAGWASVALPAAPFGFGQTSVDARFDPTQDQSKFGMAISRPVGDSLMLTLKNSYAVTGSSIGTLPSVPVAAGAAGIGHEVGRAVRFDLLPTNTAVSAGATLSSTDDKWLRTIAAEQKVYGPLSVTGAMSETSTGLIDRSLKAGFKKTW